MSLEHHQDCPFCNDEVDKGRLTQMSDLWKVQGLNTVHPTSILHDQGDFIVRPDLFPASDRTHTLLTPKEHFHAFAHLPTVMMGGAIEMIRMINNRIEQGVMIIEHGTGKDHQVFGKSIGHAHIHAVEKWSEQNFETLLAHLHTDFPGKVVVLENVTETQVMMSLAGIVGLYPYLLLFDPSKKKAAIVVEQGEVKASSQYMKRKIASERQKETGQGFINWKEMSLEESLLVARHLWQTVMAWELGGSKVG